MEHKTPQEILIDFYKENNLDDDGGQGSPHVRIEITKQLVLYFPNFEARRRAVIKHDIHHIVTGYPASTLLGESEISAWEIASGCKKYWPAFFLDTSGVMIGILINPIKVLKAFARGRRTKNLYHEIISNETALNTEIRKLQQLLKLDIYTHDTKSTVIDIMLFCLFCIFGGIYSILALPLLPLVMLYTLYINIKNKKQPILDN